MKSEIDAVPDRSASFSIHEDTKIYNLINYSSNSPNKKSLTKPLEVMKPKTSKFMKKKKTAKKSSLAKILRNNLYVLSCSILCLNAGITFVPDFHEQLKLTMGYSETLIKQLTTVGVAFAASVGFVLDNILSVIPLRMAVVVNSMLLSIVFVCFMGILNIDSAHNLTGAKYFFTTALLFVVWAILNFLSGLNFFISLKTARLYTKDKRKSTVIGILSCSYGLSISFLSLIHDACKCNILSFFGTLSVINLGATVIYAFIHQPPSWYTKQENKINNINAPNSELNRRKTLASRIDSSVFVNTSAVLENTILTSVRNESINYSKTQTKSRIISKIVSRRSSNVFDLKEIPAMTFFEELTTFGGSVCVLTVFLCVGIQKNIYFIIRELSKFILLDANKYKSGSPEFIKATKKLVSTYGKIISLTSALSRLLSGMVLDFLYQKQWVYSPYPMIMSFITMLFSASLFAAISPFWAVKTTLLQCIFGLSGGIYGIMPIIFGIVFSVEKFNKMLGFAEFSSTFGMLLFANLTTIIELIFGPTYQLNIYFGICAGFMLMLNILNHYAKKKFNKNLLNK